MNAHAKVKIGHSVCPHDCPSTCALDVELLGGNSIGRVHGAKDNDYTAGVICAKVARYAERIHHPDRLMHPLRRKGAEGLRRSSSASPGTTRSTSRPRPCWPPSGAMARRRCGPTTMPAPWASSCATASTGCGMPSATRACTPPSARRLAWTGYIAGTGKLAGPDPREMAKSDLVVIWGTNPVNTQVNVMTHAIRARKERGAKIVAIDIYHNGTMQQADLALCVRPGTDGALACAVMHVLFRDGHANWPYMEQYTDCPRELERTCATRRRNGRAPSPA